MNKKYYQLVFQRTKHPVPTESVVFSREKSYRYQDVISMVWHNKEDAEMMGKYLLQGMTDDLNFRRRYISPGREYYMCEFSYVMEVVEADYDKLYTLVFEDSGKPYIPVDVIRARYVDVNLGCKGMLVFYREDIVKFRKFAGLFLDQGYKTKPVSLGEEVCCEISFGRISNEAKI